MRSKFSSIPLVYLGGLVLAVLLTGAAEPVKPVALPVMSVREFTLKPGVKPEVFEKFVRTELRLAVRNLSGLKIRVLKGDRGERKGAYYLVWEFESVAARDGYFPREGSWFCGPALDVAWKQIGPVMGKFKDQVKLKDEYTDYVEMTE